MELKYSALLPAGIVVVVVLAILFFVLRPKRGNFKEGVKVANTNLLKDVPYLKKKLLWYRILKVAMIIPLLGAILLGFVLMAEPYYIKTTKEEKYSRDIMICLDISTSVDDLNAKLVKELQETVRHLSGERVGITIFNTTPVLLSPLTDDYEYTIEQLENIEKGLKAMNGKSFGELENWLYWNSYLYTGTLIGNEERGSSLIGDGLLGALFNFPKEDKDEKRTKIIIFSTDNDPNGEGFVNLLEAADYCKKYDTVVYGIGTKTMKSKDMDEMRLACENTGGKFFLEENSSTFHEIVEEIENRSANLVKGKTIVTHVEDPEKFYRALVVAFVLLVFFAILLRRWDYAWIGRTVAMALCLSLFFVFVIKPARWSSMGEGSEVKTKSNLQVVICIDDTISMVANDQDGRTRMEAAKEDCKFIVDSLQGAKFSVLDFHNETTVLCPFTNNSDHVKSVIDSISPLSTYYAKGSSLNTPKDAIVKTLKMASQAEGNELAIFFISDGEITDDSVLESYMDAGKYVHGGAVLGYGTAQGGTMSVQHSWEEEPTEIMDYSDYPSKPAVSKIDEENLRSIARDMGVVYIHMNNERELNAVLSDLKSKLSLEVYTEEDVEETDEGQVVTRALKDNNWYFLMIPMLLALIWEAYLLMRKR